MTAVGFSLLPVLAGALITGVAGVGGIILASRLTARRDAGARAHAFLVRQLDELYAPLVALRSEILARSKLRVTLQAAAQQAWSEICAEAGRDPEPLDRAADLWTAHFKALIEGDNAIFKTVLLPAYKTMIALLRDKLALAEPETRAWLPELITFVDVWERHLDGTIPPEVIGIIDHSETHLHGFYDHIAAMETSLRARAKAGA